MANSVRIKYHGEVLCCLDQTEVKAVEPYVYWKAPRQNLLTRVFRKACTYLSGRPCKNCSSTKEEQTKIYFKDGTWIRIRIPFIEFVDAYC